MTDQAYKLRELIGTAGPVGAPAAPGPPMVVVTGGKAGVGTTTVAVNLAAALADRGERVVLVDAAQHDANVPKVAGATTAIARSIGEVLAGTCTAAEALAPGPCGSLLLAGSSRVSPRRGYESRRDAPTWADADFSRHAQQRLFGELQTLGSKASLIVIDAGRGLTPWTRRFWLRSGLVILVTTTDDLTLMDCYAQIKRSAADGIDSELRVLANQCDGDGGARDAYGRLSAACRRFLSREVLALPALPRSIPNRDVDACWFPRVWEAPNSAFGHAALWLGRAVSDLLDERMQDAGCGMRGAGIRVRALHPASSIL